MARASPGFRNVDEPAGSIDLVDRVAERPCVRDSKLKILADQLFIVGIESRCVQEAHDPRDVIVREQMGRVFIQESCSDEHFELLVAIELKHAADAVQDLAADSAFARFQAAERTAIDLGEERSLLLSQTALVSEPRQHSP